MATAAKKSSHSSHKPAVKAAHSAAKIATHSASKTAAAAFSAAESSRATAHSMVKVGTDTMKEFFSTSSEEAQKAHDKVFAIGRESTENLSRAVGALTNTLSDVVALGRENAEALVEVNQIAADVAKSINSELVNFANTNFADNIEFCKEAFGCRNLSDAADIQSKWLSTNLDNFFSQSSRLAEMFFELATEASEPLNERVAEATERFSKALAA